MSYTNLDVEQLIKRGNELEAIRQTIQTKGWEVLEKHFKFVLDITLQALTVEESSAKVVVLQERYRAFNSMLDTVKSFQVELEEIRQELQAREKDSLYNEKYGLRE